MPKLPSQAATAAKQAAQNSGADRKPLPADTYEVRLTNVKVTNAKKSGAPMWVWELEVVEGEYRGRKLWVNTVIGDTTMWKVGEMFAAFGGDPEETDTDELIGDRCYAEVVQREIAEGARAGQTGNDVRRCSPIGGDEAAQAAGVAGGSSEAGGGDPGW